MIGGLVWFGLEDWFGLIGGLSLIAHHMLM
jgi:hypothetical protein